MTHNDKKNKFNTNIKEILAKKIRKYRYKKIYTIISNFVLNNN